MSSTIWTQCGGSSRFGTYVGRPYRVVEAQHVIATRKLVDTLEEHELLEQLIEEHKPPLPDECAGIDYLLATPFRYPPLRHGSRFGTVTERGIWYGAERLRTAFAEVAYYRLLFLAGSAAELEPVEAEFTAFQATVRSAKYIDLTAVPFAAHARRISDKGSYRHAQPLGAAMRKAGVEVFRYASAREQPETGSCVGVFVCSVFSPPRPRGHQSWRGYATRERVEFVRSVDRRQRYAFPRGEFELDGRLPDPLAL